MPGVTPGLTVSKTALILETSLSKPVQLRQVKPAGYCPPVAKPAGQSSRPAIEQARRPNGMNLQGSNILLAVPGATPELHSKLIKEDHFLACTTRMFETKRPARKADRLDLSKPHCTQCFWTHILAASDYSLVKEHWVWGRDELLQMFVASPGRKRWWPLSSPSSVIPVRGGGILSAVLSLSTGCGEKFFSSLGGGFRRRKVLSGPILSTGRPEGLDRPKWHPNPVWYNCMLLLQRAINICIAAVQAPRPMSTGGR